jgi:hypothetical protein
MQADTTIELREANDGDVGEGIQGGGLYSWALTTFYVILGHFGPFRHFLGK